MDNRGLPFGHELCLAPDHNSMSDGYNAAKLFACCAWGTYGRLLLQIKMVRQVLPHLTVPDRTPPNKTIPNLTWPDHTPINLTKAHHFSPYHRIPLHRLPFLTGPKARTAPRQNLTQLTNPYLYLPCL